MAFKAVTEDLQTADDYELITYRMMERLKAQHVLHAEVYVSVGVNSVAQAGFRGDSSKVWIADAASGERDFGVSLLWIFDAVRQFGPVAAREVFEVAARYRERSVVAIGMGGDEQKGPPELFRDAYAYAAENGLHLTAHAGENAGPESIWGALNLRAERIGHGLTAAQDPELVEELSTRQVPVEICLTSNLRPAPVLR